MFQWTYFINLLIPKVHKEGCKLRPILSMVGSSQNKLAKFLIEYQPQFSISFQHKICSPEHLTDELKTIKNIFSSLDYIGKILERVVKQTTSSKSIKSFGPEKCTVYIRLPYFAQASERFTHRLSKEIENVYHTIKLRPVFCTRKA